MLQVLAETVEWADLVDSVKDLDLVEDVTQSRFSKSGGGGVIFEIGSLKKLMVVLDATTFPAIAFGDGVVDCSLKSRIWVSVPMEEFGVG